MSRFVKNCYAINLGGGAGGGGSLSQFNIFRDLDLNSTPQLIFAPPGGLFGWHVTNFGPGFVYVKFYDTEISPVIGTDTPVLVLAIPEDGIDQIFSPSLMPFTNSGWVIATTGVANDDATNPGANQVVANIFYAG